MIEGIIFILILVFDQVTKYFAAKNNINISVIDDVLSFKYVENRGAAFSFLADASWGQTFFKILTSIALVAFVAYYIFNRKSHITFRIALAMIISGALGNFIDRLAFNYVRDFIFVEFFANFNIADMGLCIGAGVFVLYFLFFDKDAIFKKKIKTAELTAEKKEDNE